MARPSKVEDGPGWAWSLLEFMGMTWPGRKQQAEAARAPRCSACGNPARRVDGAWRCQNHPGAACVGGADPPSPPS
jgi:hypothetical protein